MGGGGEALYDLSVKCLTRTNHPVEIGSSYPSDLTVLFKLIS
jgi:hypothetical protein